MIGQSIFGFLQIAYELRNVEPGSKWWSDYCREKVANYRHVWRFGKAMAQKHALGNAKKFAKRKYWQNKV